MPFPSTLTIDREITLGSADFVAGGLKASNVRLLASLDYALSHNVLLGARIGYVLRTDPSPTFGRWHLEGRLTYAIGHDALTREGAPIPGGPRRRRVRCIRPRDGHRGK